LDTVSCWTERRAIDPFVLGVLLFVEWRVHWMFVGVGRREGTWIWYLSIEFGI
jgi:hypothetical protein